MLYVLQTCWIVLKVLLTKTFNLMIRLQNVLKTSSRRICETFWRRFQDALKTSWQDVLKTLWQDILKTSWKRLEDVWTRRIYWSWPRRLEDVFWRYMINKNILAFIKTSFEDECLLGVILAIMGIIADKWMTCICAVPNVCQVNTCLNFTLSTTVTGKEIENFFRCRQQWSPLDF